MSKNLNTPYRILQIACMLSVLALGLVIYFYKTGYLTGNLSKFYGMLAFLPLFAGHFIYPVVTGKAVVGYHIIEKEKLPGLFYASVVFWGIMVLITVGYILKNL